MHEFSFISTLTSSEWASWVQAIGSIFAIVGTALIAIWQSHKQHQISLSVLRAEHRMIRIETAKTLSEFSKNVICVVEHVVKRLSDREAVHTVAERNGPSDLNELIVLERAVLAVPLHSLPHSLVTLTMFLSSTIRQFRENVEGALENHRNMSSESFSALFSVLAECLGNLKRIAEEIDSEVVRASNETYHNHNHDHDHG